jgi:hypothetical protein
MRAEARFANPDEAEVTITLRGTLKQFDDLSRAIMAEGAVPYWQARALVDAISEAAHKLRDRVSVERDAPEGHGQ